MKKENQNWSGEYEKSYSGSSYNKDERSHYASRKVEPKPSDAPRRDVPPRPQSTQDPQNPPTQERKNGLTWKHFIMIWLVFTILWNGINWLMGIDASDVDEQPEETIDYPWTTDDMDSEEDIESASINDVVDDETGDASVSESSANASTDNDATVSDDDLSTLEEFERRNHAEVVKAAKRVGVSTEGTTEEILNRIIEKQLESIR